MMHSARIRLEVLGCDEPIAVGVKQPPRLLQVCVLVVRQRRKRHVPSLVPRTASTQGQKQFATLKR